MIEGGIEKGVEMISRRNEVGDKGLKEIKDDDGSDRSNERASA